jgi:hypothetical protein
MGTFLICLLMSVMIGSGLAIVLVEKGNDWPVKPIRVRIQWVQSHIHTKMPQMLYCSTCTSFWTTLISDIVVGTVAYLHGHIYFLWPFSGFVAAGFVWTIIELLNVMDKEQNINVLVGDPPDESEAPDEAPDKEISHEDLGDSFS